MYFSRGSVLDKIFTSTVSFSPLAATQQYSNTAAHKLTETRLQQKAAFLSRCQSKLCVVRSLRAPRDQRLWCASCSGTTRPPHSLWAAAQPGIHLEPDSLKDGWPCGGRTDTSNIHKGQSWEKKCKIISRRSALLIRSHLWFHWWKVMKNIWNILAKKFWVKNKRKTSYFVYFLSKIKTCLI